MGTSSLIHVSVLAPHSPIVVPLLYAELAVFSADTETEKKKNN